MDETKFRQIVLANLSRYPRMQIADLYKLCHQAALGSEHALKDERAVREWLMAVDEVNQSSIARLEPCDWRDHSHRPVAG